MQEIDRYIDRYDLKDIDLWSMIWQNVLDSYKQIYILKNNRYEESEIHINR